MTTRSFRRLLFVGALACGCASAPRPRPEAPARAADTAPDKAAALRAASGDLHQEQDADRWAIDAARERKQRDDRQKADAASKAAALQVRPTPAPPAP
jgi:hypothetical protein